MEITIKNHYIPCSWAALWNRDYLDFIEGGNETLNFKKRLREQKVNILNLKVDKVYIQKTENIFFETGINSTNIDEAQALDFFERNLPEDIEEVRKIYQEEPESIYGVNHENFFTFLENNSREAILRTIFYEKVKHVMDKTLLADFILLQYVRNPVILNSRLESFKSTGRSEFEYFWHWRNAYRSTPALFHLLAPLIFAEWTLYKFDNSVIPLSDHPVIFLDKMIICPLSPKIIIEINLKEGAKDKMCVVKNSMKSSKLETIKSYIINQTVQYLIFVEPEIAESWRLSKQVRDKIATLTKKLYKIIYFI